MSSVFFLTQSNNKGSLLRLHGIATGAGAQSCLLKKFTAAGIADGRWSEVALSRITSGELNKDALKKQEKLAQLDGIAAGVGRKVVC